MSRVIRLFFPNKRNRYRPELLEKPLLLGMALGALFLELALLSFSLLAVPGSGYLSAVIASVLIDGTNQYRAEAGIPPLSENPLLAEAARAKAEDMAERGYFSHEGPDGRPPWVWIQETGYDYAFAGENLAVNFVDSEDVISAWIESDGHRDNLLGAQFTEIGIGTASGRYDGREAIFVVQFFGTPRFQRAFFAPIASAAPLAAEDVGAGYASGSPQGSSSSGGAAYHLKGEVPTIVEKALSSPRTLFNYIFISFFLLFGIVLIFSILVKVRIQYPRMIAQAALMLFFIYGLMYLNYMILVAPGAI